VFFNPVHHKHHTNHSSHRILLNSNILQKPNSDQKKVSPLALQGEIKRGYGIVLGHLSLSTPLVQVANLNQVVWSFIPVHHKNLPAKK